MLKIDETFVDPKIRWCPLDNQIYGFCYEHGHNVEMTFRSYDDVTNLANLVENSNLHVGKECMVIVTSNNSVIEDTQVVISWPTCSRSEVIIQRNFIKQFSKLFKEKNGAPLLCWATDGE